MVEDDACARFILNSLAVLYIVFALERSEERRRGRDRRDEAQEETRFNDGRTKNAVGRI